MKFLSFVNIIQAKALQGFWSLGRQRAENKIPKAGNLHSTQPAGDCSHPFGPQRMQWADRFLHLNPFSKIITVMQQSFHKHTVKGKNQDLLGTWIKMHSRDTLILQGYTGLLFTRNSFCLVNFAISSNSHKHIILIYRSARKRRLLTQYKWRICNNDFI